MCGTKCHQEQIATDTIHSDIPAIGNRTKVAEIIVGTVSDHHNVHANDNETESGTESKTDYVETSHNTDHDDNDNNDSDDDDDDYG